MRPPARHRVGARDEHLPLGHLEVVDAGAGGVATGDDVELSVRDERGRIGGVVSSVGENRIRRCANGARFQLRRLVGAGSRRNGGNCGRDARGGRARRDRS